MGRYFDSEEATRIGKAVWDALGRDYKYDLEDCRNLGRALIRELSLRGFRIEKESIEAQIIAGPF